MPQESCFICNAPTTKDVCDACMQLISHPRALRALASHFDNPNATPTLVVTYKNKATPGMLLRDLAHQLETPQMVEYEFDIPESCAAAGRHLVSCDADGHCNECGYQEHPGLYKRYQVTKTSGESSDPMADYFVTRLDSGGDDPSHIWASRVAAHVYAKTILQNPMANHLHKMANELRAKLKAMPPLFRMTTERQRIVTQQRDQPLSAVELAVGYHGCPEWDGLVISPEYSEWGDDFLECRCGYQLC